MIVTWHASESMFSIVTEDASELKALDSNRVWKRANVCNRNKGTERAISHDSNKAFERVMAWNSNNVFERAISYDSNTRNE